MRIYELAKKIGIDTKELIEKLQNLNFPVKSHMSVIDEETAEIITHEIESLKKKEIEQNVVEVDFPITVKELAVKLNIKPSELLSKFLKEGKFYTINQNLDEKTAKDIAYQYKINLVRKLTIEEKILKQQPIQLVKRPPVVTLMGHIDHGKTSLLDYIRKSKIAEKEAGGITQHIGAYQVKLPKGTITFLDTPGHEAFTAMRARGANVTDIVVLVVAADEGVKPQTEEAIDHAKVASIPIIVAINKIDKPTANPDMVKQQLSKLGLVPEDWGGKTITVNVSAKTGKGVDELLELILLQAEVMELKADIKRPAIGVVIDVKLSKGAGPLATVLIQEGVLRVGDFCVCGLYCGRIRSMRNDRAELLERAYPSDAVEISGLNGLPNPADKLLVVENEKDAHQIIERRKEEEEKRKISSPRHFKLEDLNKKITQEKKLSIILKADVAGTLEAVEEALKKISTEEVEVNIVHRGVGTINTSDVLLADVTDAIIVGFKVSADASSKDLAKQKGIEIRIYQIVYELLDDIKAALEGLLAPQIKRVFYGRAKVKVVFKLSKAGTVAGCIVEKGKIVRGLSCCITRDGKIIFEGKILSLKRFKDDVKEVTEGLECGINVGWDDIKEEDVIDVFGEEIISRRL
ncbi:MAG: translation initiation factor IF-2 [Candidatus Omnitrophica bacterium]|nr:translation initiation factor IF-2 [Candidatus Omnitrophota bacterium]